MAVNDVLASLYLEFIGLLELSKKNLKYFDFVLEGQNERVAVRINCPRIESSFAGVIGIQKIAAKNTFISLNTPQSYGVRTSQ